MGRFAAVKTSNTALIKGHFYKMVIRPPLFHGVEFWATHQQEAVKIHVAEIDLEFKMNA